VTLVANIIVHAAPPSPVPDDNGHASFIRQVVPKLLGRRPKGTEEVRLLADMSAQVGREAVIRLLMQQPEFITHWTATLIDQLEMQREGTRAQETACFNAPSSGTPLSEAAATSSGSTLAAFVRDHSITAAAPESASKPFNMHDLIRSALLLDDLAPVYRAYLYPLGYRGNGDSEDDRSRVASAFHVIYLNRQIGCLQCHNSAYSTTPHFPLYSHLDYALFDHTAEQKAFANDNIGTTATLAAGPFRGDFYPLTAKETGFGPWGMTTACAEVVGTPSLGPISAFFAGLEGSFVSVLELDAAFMAGYENLKAGRGSLAAADEFGPLARETAFAYLVAAKVVENVWQEIMGEPLTLVNAFARNATQRDMHQSLIEDAFLPGWSLKELLVAIFKTRFFNRKPPLFASSATPYALPPIFDPYTPHTAPCTVPTPGSGSNDTLVILPSHNQSAGTPASTVVTGVSTPAVSANMSSDSCNGQGELVHRYAPRVLLNAASSALQWPRPQIFPGRAFPSKTLTQAVGQYLSTQEPGSPDVDFQALLSWETAFGLCEKPVEVTGDDWIDKLDNSIAAYNPAPADAPLTLRDVVLTLKDWLLQEPVLGGPERSSAGHDGTPSTWVSSEAELIATEGTLLESYFGVDLDTPAQSLTALKEQLRGLCGIYLKSPQFMMAGIIRAGTFEAPRLRVCNGMPCTYKEMCQAYTPALGSLGHVFQCPSGKKVLPFKATRPGE
jgi:hypothetical protein